MRNWAGDQVWAPASVVEPGTEGEVAEAVTRASRVRVIGSGHSFTDVAATEHTQLRLHRLDRIIAVDGSSVRVQAGIRLRELGEELAARGLAMENLGDVDAQALAGALATGTHGTGLGFRNLSSQVESMRLITADGSAVEVEGDDLRAARVSLGALGVVTEITLRCQPLYTLRRTDDRMPLDDTLDRLDELSRTRERFEFFSFPYSQWALSRTTETTDDPPAPENRWLEDVVIENGALGAFCRLGRAVPRLVPQLNRAISRAASGGVRVDRSHRIYANPRLVHFTEMEYAIPWEAGPEAVRRVFELVERRRLPVLFPVEVRSGAPDDAFLSPAFGRETCYVAVHVYRGMEFETYFRAVEAIMRELGGRPHWGKRHYRTAAELSASYPEWDAFARVRDRLDPERKFANDYTERVLGA